MIPKIACLGLFALVPLLGAREPARPDGGGPAPQEDVTKAAPAPGDAPREDAGPDGESSAAEVRTVEAATPAPGPLLQIRAREIVVGDGRVIENGVLVIRNGRITKVGADVAIDENHPLVVHDGVLTAGMIAAHSQMGVEGDANEAARTIVSEARIALAFRPSDAELERALAAGITAVVLSPTGENLVGGMTAVVKTAGGAVVKDGAHLALSFSRNALQGRSRPAGLSFFDAEATPAAAVDGGPESTEAGGSGDRYPTSYSGAMRELEARFTHPEGAFARAAESELPVLIEAWDRHEVVRAAQFAKRFSLRGAIRGAPLAGDESLRPLLAASGLGVILGPFGPGQTRRSLASVAALQEDGIPVAFALTGREGSPESLRVTAARAIGAGADPAAVWRALTSDAARLAGVEQRLGLLAPGRDADVVLWSGEPLNLTSRVVAVYVDGKRVQEGASR